MTFRARLHSAGWQLRVVRDVFPEGTVIRVWIGPVLLKARFPKAE